MIMFFWCQDMCIESDKISQSFKWICLIKGSLYVHVLSWFILSSNSLPSGCILFLAAILSISLILIPSSVAWFLTLTKIYGLRNSFLKFWLGYSTLNPYIKAHQGLKGSQKSSQWFTVGKNSDSSVYSFVQSCPRLCDPMDYSLPSSSVHGIFQARILEWVAIFCSRGSSWPRVEPASLLSPVLVLDSLPLHHLGLPTGKQ